MAFSPQSGTHSSFTPTGGSGGGGVISVSVEYFSIKLWWSMINDQWKLPFSGAKKGSSDASIKNEHHFLSSTIPKMVEETLVSCEYHYRVSFGQILKIAHFMIIFGRFLLIKSQNQNPMVHSVNFWDKNLIFGIWFPYIQGQLDPNGWVKKMNFAFWGPP